MQATARTHREFGSPRADSQILRPHKQQYLTSSALSSGNNNSYHVLHRYSIAFFACFASKRMVLFFSLCSIVLYMKFKNK